MLKVVVFDIDNTLYDYDYCHHRALFSLQKYACHNYGLSKEQFVKNFDLSKRIVKKQLGSTASSHNRMLYMQIFLELIGENPVQGALSLYNIYWNELLDNMTPFEYVEPLMKNLVKRNIKVSILTDLTAHIQHRKIIRMNLSQYVSSIVTSEEVGCEKPSSVGFQKIATKNQVSFKEMLMVGDSVEKDIKGARQVGMHAVHFNKNEPSDAVRKIWEFINVQNN